MRLAGRKRTYVTSRDRTWPVLPNLLVLVGLRLLRSKPVTNRKIDYQPQGR